MLSHIQTTWYQLSTIYDGPPFSPERSFAMQSFHLSKFWILPLKGAKENENVVLFIITVNVLQGVSPRGEYQFD